MHNRKSSQSATKASNPSIDLPCQCTPSVFGLDVVPSSRTHHNTKLQRESESQVSMHVTNQQSASVFVFAMRILRWSAFIPLCWKTQNFAALGMDSNTGWQNMEGSEVFQIKAYVTKLLDSRAKGSTSWEHLVLKVEGRISFCPFRIFNTWIITTMSTMILRTISNAFLVDIDEIPCQFGPLFSVLAEECRACRFRPCCSCCAAPWWWMLTLDSSIHLREPIRPIRQ